MSEFAGLDILRLFPFTASGLLVALSHWLNRRYPRTLPRSWTLAHSFCAAAFGFEFASHANGRPAVLNVLAATTFGFCGIYLVDTGLQLKNPGRSRNWFRWAAPLCLAVPAIAEYFATSFLGTVAPTVIFGSSAFVWLGIVVTRLPDLGDPLPTRVLASALAAVGISILLYPAIADSALGPISIWLDGALLLLIGVAMAVRLLERHSRELEVLIDEGKHRAMVLLDPSGRISSWNRGAERLFGMQAAETISHDHSVLGSSFRLDPEQSSEQSGWIDTKGGGRFFGETTISPIRGPDRKLRGYAMLVRDVSDRRALEHEKSRLAAAVQQSQDAMAITDWNGLVLYANPAFEQRTGRQASALMTRDVFALFGDETEIDISDIQKGLATGGGWSARLRSRRPDGSRLIEDLHIWPLWTGGPGATPDFVVVARDITREYLLQEQLYQSQKMEEIGRIAGGVAHDFGNLLAIIVAYNHLLQTSKPSRQVIETSTTAIRRATDRASALIRQLLAFGRKEISTRRVVDLHQLIEQTASMLTRVMGEGVTLRTECRAGHPRVRIDPGQVEQVITNLVVNARDAMPTGGEVVLETSNEDVRDETEGLAAGVYVCLAVRDQGVGITPADQARVFEPFFTTKPPGLGTGLGLAVVAGIVAEAQGTIRVESEPGKGSTFRVFLPTTAAPLARDGNAAEEPRWAVPTERGTVLVAAAECDACRTAVALLHAEGYRVLEAHTEEEALRLGRKHEGEIDLLLGKACDGPNDALALSVALQRDQPDMRLLLLAGAEDDRALRSAALSGAQVLTPPIRRDELLQKLEELIGDAEAPDAGARAASSPQ